MSRIYDALKRAAEGAKRREVQTAPFPPEDGVRPPETSPMLVAAVSAPSQSRRPPAIRSALRQLGEDLTVHSANQVDEQASVAIQEFQTYRQEVRQRLQGLLTAERERMASDGKYPFEGRWLTIPEIRRLRRTMRWRDLGILVQLLFLFCFMGFTGLIFFRVLTQFFVPQ